VSRAAFKLNARKTSAAHTAAERATAYALAYNRPQGLNRTKLLRKLFPAWDAVGIVQHHDSMTGTMSAIGTYTAWGSSDRNATRLQESLCTASNPDCQTLEDYTARLQTASDNSAEVIAEVLDTKSGQTEETSTHFTVFNSLAQRRTSVVGFPLAGVLDPGVNGVGVRDARGDPVQAQLSRQNDTVYIVANVSSLSTASFDIVSPCTSDCAELPTITEGVIDLSNTHGTTVTMAESTGLPEKINGVHAQHRYAQYHAEQGGPYVLIEMDSASPLPAHSLLGSVSAIGPIFQEVESTFDLGYNSSGDLISTTRVYTDPDCEQAGIVEIQHGVPEKIGDNRELIMHVATGLATDGSLWTDESGLEMHERAYDPTLPISGNYHVREHVTVLCLLRYADATISVRRVLYCRPQFAQNARPNTRDRNIRRKTRQNRCPY